MKRRRIKIKFLVFVLFVALMVVILLTVTRELPKNWKPPFRQNNKNVEKDLSTTTTTNTEERNEELEASEESEEEFSDSGSPLKFSDVVEEANKKATIEELIRNPQTNNSYEQLFDGTRLSSVKKRLTNWIGRTRNSKNTKGKEIKK